MNNVLTKIFLAIAFPYSLYNLIFYLLLVLHKGVIFPDLFRNVLEAIYFPGSRQLFFILHITLIILTLIILYTKNLGENIKQIQLNDKVLYGLILAYSSYSILSYFISDLIFKHVYELIFLTPIIIFVKLLIISAIVQTWNLKINFYKIAFYFTYIIGVGAPLAIPPILFFTCGWGGCDYKEGLIAILSIATAILSIASIMSIKINNKDILKSKKLIILHTITLVLIYVFITQSGLIRI